MGIQDDPVSWHSVSWKGFVFSFPGNKSLCSEQLICWTTRKVRYPWTWPCQAETTDPHGLTMFFPYLQHGQFCTHFQNAKIRGSVGGLFFGSSPNLCWTPRGLSILVVIGWLLKAWSVEGFVDWLIDRLTAGWIGLPDGWWIGHVELMCSLLDGLNDGVIDWLNGRSFRWMFSWDVSGDENMTDIFWNKNGTIKFKKMINMSQNKKKMANNWFVHDPNQNGVSNSNYEKMRPKHVPFVWWNVFGTIANQQNTRPTSCRFKPRQKKWVCKMHSDTFSEGKLRHSQTVFSHHSFGIFGQCGPRTSWVCVILSWDFRPWFFHFSPYQILHLNHFSYV